MDYLRIVVVMVMNLILLLSDVTAAPDGCSPKVDLVLVVDSSESMVVDDPYGKPLQNWNRMKAYLAGVVRGLPVSPSAHRIALIHYASDVGMEFLFDQLASSSDVADHILTKLAHMGGNTKTAVALEWAHSYMLSAKRPNTKTAVLIFTDGISRNGAQTRAWARTLKIAGVEVFTVSLDTGDVDADELYHIASSSYHRIIAPNGLDQSAWEYSINQAVYGICGLPVPPRDPICDAVLDLALVIDNSGSITNGSISHENYILLKQFVVSLLDTLHIGPNKTRVAAIRFSTDIKVEFQLDTYLSDKAGMKRHVQNMEFEGRDTHISGALKKTHTDIFRPEFGDRPFIPNVVLLIADGQSNINYKETKPAARVLKENSKVFVVAVVTNDFNKEELEYIATDPDKEHYFESLAITTLPIIKCKLLKEICKEEIFSQCV